MGTFTYKNRKHTYDDHIYIDQIDSEYLILTQDYHYDDHVVPSGFEWNGASSPNVPLARFISPKFYKNIKASCIHDFMCSKARNNKERRDADERYFMFKKYVEKDYGWKSMLSWAGVRIGAFFGVGSSYK